MNDLPTISKFFMPILFARDILFTLGLILKILFAKETAEIKTIYWWVKVNNLSLNIDKTNNELKFDNELNWKCHVTYPKNKNCKRHWHYIFYTFIPVSEL